MKRALFILLLLVVAVQFGCTKAGIKQQVIFEMGRDHVYLVHEQDKDGNVLPKGFNHPAQFSPEQVDQLLESLRYSEYSFFKWRGDKQVFVESERKKLSKHLSQAFEATGPDNWIKFAVTAKKRDLLLPTRRLTDGYMFVTDGRLNIVLANLNFELSDTEDSYGGDPRDRYALGALRLKEAENMTHPAVDPTDELLKRPHNNWIVINYEKIFAEQEAEAGEGEKVERVETKPEKTVDERLLELKELLDKGLITQEDYDRKKAELLKDLEPGPGI